MNNMKQLRALLRFYIAMNPFTMLLPLVFGLQCYIPFLTSSRSPDYAPALRSVLQNQIIWVVCIFSAALMAPEAMGSANSNSALTGLEFLLTRAIDRRLLLRARSVLYYSFVLALPLAVYLSTFASPALRVTETDKVAHQEVLEQIPGSIAGQTANTITIPNGSTLVEGWYLWLFVCAAITGQVFIYAVYPLKCRKYIYWGAAAVIICVGMAPIVDLIQHPAAHTSGKTFFFAFTAHQPLCWCGAIAALLFGQFWCEGRFARTEQ